MGLFDKLKGSNKEDKTSFKYLNELIHSGQKEIILENDIILKKSEKNSFTEGISIDVDDIIIDGNGHIIDAQGQTKIFNVTGKDIILKNVTLQNGIAEYGAAIDNINGKITLINTRLQNNVVQNLGSGAAISNSDGEMTIINCFFSNNKSDGSGGAIHNGYKMIIEESTLKNNKATYDGGAITNDVQLIIKNTTLEDNNAGYKGGAIINWGVIQIKNCVIKNNIAHEFGGAVWNFKSVGQGDVETLKIIDSKIDDNIPDDIYRK